MHVAWILGALALGIGLGAAGHAILLKDAGIAKEDLAFWAERLRSSLACDLESGRRHIRAVLAGIETKLKL